MTAIYFQGGKSEARKVVSTFVAALGGATNELSGLAQGVYTALGFAALSDIKADFVRKARGQTGEDGNSWPRLSPKTLAYSRRFGPGEQSRLKKSAGLGRGNNNRGLLSAAQDKRWKQIYGTRLARFAASMPMAAAKAKAAQVAWATLKAEGAKTKLEVYGNREHEALRDSGILLNSLSPGQIDGGESGSVAYTKPSGPGGEDQVFKTFEGGIIVGTNVPYAETHNDGDASRGIPERRFIPRDDQVPQIWLDRWLNVGRQAVASSLRLVLSRGM